ncbi:hypothetical protein XA26_50300 [Mycolicibacterium fortuitum]|uniref:Uncharacterized protein n=2 Tax=Mycolicibacterium fortuitum TaxID=1766 RepID=A0A0N9XL95_MYCFO|nr:hypothetical protein XA26_50300 [Mycolicibacterium fortuitum]
MPGEQENVQPGADKLGVLSFAMAADQLVASRPRVGTHAPV